MSLQLKSISQLSSIPYQEDEQSLSAKYSSLFANDAQSYAEISFKSAEGTELSSMRIDFKTFLADIQAEIERQINNVAGKIPSIDGYATQSWVNYTLSNYVTIGTNQVIYGPKTFSGETKFSVPTYVNSKLVVTGDTEMAILKVKGKAAVLDSNLNEKITLDPSGSGGYNVKVNGTMNVTGNAELTANHAKWS